MRILVAEDHLPSLEALKAFLESEGHVVFSASEGPRAVSLMEQHHPDLCLLDVNLPRMSGFEVAAAIRERCGPRWVPILFLSALSEVADVLQGLASGGDDYLTKPVNFSILAAKIRAMERIHGLQSELARHYDRIEEEHQLAQTLLERLCNSSGRQDPALKWTVMPLHRFSGDQISAYRSPEGVFTVLLADAMGHGLSAAICLMPILKIFSERAPLGVPLETMTRDMNRELRALIPTSRFVALLLVRMDCRNRELTVWNGGIPTCLLLGENGGLLRAFEPQHPPMGILPDALFQAAPERYDGFGASAATLLACSDGLSEAMGAQGHPYDTSRILEAWREGPWQTGFERVLAGTFQHLAGEPLSDDLSLFTLDCGRGRAQVPIEHGEEGLDAQGFGEVVIKSSL